MKTKLFDLFTKEELEKAIADGYVVERSHPSHEDLKILDYTNKAQFDGVWNDVVCHCRGLIYSKTTGLVVARGPKKFFNYEQIKETVDTQLWNFGTKNFVRSVKQDGSCGILYKVPYGGFAISTRGSFQSDQAIKATEMLSYYRSIDYLDFFGQCMVEDVTPVFEIIYPENQIVVNYNGLSNILFICLVDNRTGCMNFGPLYEKAFKLFDGDKAEILDENKVFESEDELNTYIDDWRKTFPSNFEGYVCTNKVTGLTFKIKSLEYCKLHANISNLSTLSIWNTLKVGGKFESMLDLIPDEFYKWGSQKEQEYKSAYDSIDQLTTSHYETVLNKVGPSATDKEIAMEIQKIPSNISKLVFTLWRKGKNEQYVGQIFDSIRPEYERPKAFID